MYADLAKNRTKAQKAELDEQLAPPEEKEAARDRRDREAQKELSQRMAQAGLMPPPPPGKPRGRAR